MKPIALVPLLLAVAACAAQDAGNYPSLAKRPIEDRGFAEPEPPAPAPVVADPALDRQIATILASLREGARAFDAAAAAAQRAATTARGKPAGSDAWIEAQTALAGLDALRADTSNASTALEQLAIERAVALQPDYPALSAAQDAARQQGEAQTKRIDALAAALPAA